MPTRLHRNVKSVTGPKESPVVEFEELVYDFPEGDPHLADPADGQPLRRDLTLTRAAADSSEAITVEECKKLCKAIGLDYQSGYEGRVVQFKFTDGTVDRYGDLIQAKGVDLSAYKKNPQILGFHNSCAWPVGRSIKTWYDKASDSVKGWVLFFDDRVDNTGVAETTFRMVKAGAINTGSIGFIPKKYSRPDEETRTKLGMGEWGYLFEECELIEFSIVPIPANPSAMAEPITKGLVTRAALDTFRRDKALAEDVLAELDVAWAKAFPPAPVPERTLEQLGAELRAAPAGLDAPPPAVETLKPEDARMRTAPVKIVIRVPFNSSAEAYQAVITRAKELSKDGFEVTLDVAPELAAPVTNVIEAQPVGDITKELEALLEKKLAGLKRELPEETRNMLQTCATSLEQALVALQDLLDSASADGEETAGKAARRGGGEGATRSAEGAPGGAPPADGDDLYHPDLLAKLERATHTLSNT